MRQIDADTHVIETAAVWDYLDPAEQLFRPQAITLEAPVMVPPIAHPMTSVWIIDGQLYARTNLEQIEAASQGEVEPGALSMTEPPPRAIQRSGWPASPIFSHCWASS